LSFFILILLIILVDKNTGKNLIYQANKLVKKVQLCFKNWRCFNISFKNLTIQLNSWYKIYVFKYFQVSKIHISKTIVMVKMITITL